LKDVYLIIFVYWILQRLAVMNQLLAQEYIYMAAKGTSFVDDVGSQARIHEVKVGYDFGHGAATHLDIVAQVGEKPHQVAGELESGHGIYPVSQTTKKASKVDWLVRGCYVVGVAK
jgi:hypothetical protein